MSSNQTHKRIDELLRLMIDHNHRLRSQDEGISQLDIDVFRKQCIELYEELNNQGFEGLDFSSVQQNYLDK